MVIAEYIITMLAPPQSVVHESIAELAEEVRQFSYHRKKIDKHNKTKRIVDVNLSELLNMEVLSNIRQAFVRGRDAHGEECLSAEEFIDTLSQYLPRTEIERLYQKIDVNDDGNVDWQEFTGFLTTSEAGVGTVVRNMHKVFTLKMEQEFDSANHRDMIDFLQYNAKPFPVLVSAGRDGQIMIWSQSDLNQIGCIQHLDKNTLFLSTLQKSMSIEQKAMVAKSVNRNPMHMSKKVNLITALALMPLSGHICVSSGDSCVSIYEVTGQEQCGRITSLTQLPTALEAFLIVDKIRDTENQCLAIGDAKGSLHLVTLNQAFGVSTDGGVRKRNQAYLSQAVEKMRTLRIHSDWISALLYITDLNRLAIGSQDGNVTFVNAQNCSVDRVFSGTGVPVRLLAWSSTARCLVSACTDRSLVVWDPYTLQISSKIDGLTALVVALYINDDAQHIIVAMSDKTIRTWDCVTFEPLHVVYDTSTQLPLNTITTALWVPSYNVLYTAGSRISAWLLERTADSWLVADDDDLCVSLFNSVFNQVLSVTYGGVVSVYNIADGHIASKFYITPSFQTKNEKSAVGTDASRKVSVVSTAVLDQAQRRLMVVTGNRTEIQLWNFHNGQCVKQIHPRVPSTLYSIPATSTTSAPEFKPYEITTLSYFNVFQGPTRFLKKFVTFGTDIGITSCLLESSDDIEDEPSYNLMKTSVTGRKKVFLESSSVVDGDLRRTRAVQWITHSCENHVLVSYRDGSMIHWDIDKSIPVVEIEPRRRDTGVSFVALKRRVVASRGHALAFNEKLRRTSLAASATLSFNEADEEDSAEFPDIPRTRATSADTIVPTVFQRTSMVDTTNKSPGKASIVGGLGLSPRGSVSTSPRKLSVVYSKHIATRDENASGSDSDEATSPSHGRTRSSISITPAVIGIARAPGFGKSTLKPLFEGSEDSSISPNNKRPSRTVRGSNKPGRVSFTSTNHISVVENGTVYEEDEHMEGMRAVPASHLEDTVHADAMSISDVSVTSEPLLRVHCAVILKMTRVIIGECGSSSHALSSDRCAYVFPYCMCVVTGSCNDGLMRLWDMDTGKTLCSCLADPNAVVSVTSAAMGTVGSPLMCLETNNAQDLLVGTYLVVEVLCYVILIS